MTGEDGDEIEDDEGGAADEDEWDPKGDAEVLQALRDADLGTLGGSAEAAPPLYIPRVPGGDFPDAMAELRSWVEELVTRFGHLDHSVIPSCWWKHNGHVEILQALMDHERVSYGDRAAGTAGMAWHREFMVAEQRLKDWTSYFGCASGHKEPIEQRRLTDETEWDAFLAAEVERRNREAEKEAAETKKGD